LDRGVPFSVKHDEGLPLAVEHIKGILDALAVKTLIDIGSALRLEGFGGVNFGAALPVEVAWPSRILSSSSDFTARTPAKSVSR
jgi:hypothetical protein